jgi:hypothetical protein
MLKFLQPSQADTIPTSQVDSQAESQAGPKMVIWGTDVDVSECKKTFRRFIENFIDPNLEPDEANLAITNVNEPIYLQKMKEVLIVEVNFFHLLTYICVV